MIFLVCVILNLSMTVPLGPKIKLVSDLESLDRFVEPPLTGSFCDLLWADPLLEEVLGYRLSDKDYIEVSKLV